MVTWGSPLSSVSNSCPQATAPLDPPEMSHGSLPSALLGILSLVLHYALTIHLYLYSSFYKKSNQITHFVIFCGFLFTLSGSRRIGVSNTASSVCLYECFHLLLSSQVT